MSAAKYVLVFFAFVDTGFAMYEHTFGRNSTEAIYWLTWAIVDLVALVCVILWKVEQG